MNLVIYYELNLVAADKRKEYNEANKLIAEFK